MLLEPLLFLLAAPAEAAPPRHAVFAGFVAGVDLFFPSRPRLVAGYPWPWPAPTLGYSVDPGKPAGVWLGLHTAPTFLVIASHHADGDVVQESANLQLLMADVGWDVYTAETAVGAYAGIGLISAEAGVRLRYVPHKVGPELRLAWVAPKAVALVVAASFGVSKER